MAIHITSKTRALKIRPETKRELITLIFHELERQGTDADLNFIDTSLITNMTYLFHQFYIRNIKIDEWDVSNVTDMEGMFLGCSGLNCDLSKWDVSNVTKMDSMFSGCHNFEGIGLDFWNVSNVQNLDNTFYECFKLNCSLSEWGPQVSNVRSLNNTFEGCTIFNGDLSSWFITCNSANCTGTFLNCGIEPDHKPQLFMFML
jgi:surface protein